MSRRKFLVGAGTVVGAAGLTGLGINKYASDAQAAGSAIPWPYPASPADQPNPEAVARKAFEIYFGGRGCAEAVWGCFVETLAANPANAGTWATLPINIFRFGGGGIAGWGTICGTLNGAAAMLGMLVSNSAHRVTLTDAIFQYYAKTALPTNNAYLSTQGQLGSLGAWTPATPAAEQRADVRRGLPSLPLLARPVDDGDGHQGREPGSAGPLLQGLLRRRLQAHRAC